MGRWIRITEVKKAIKKVKINISSGICIRFFNGKFRTIQNFRIDLEVTNI